MIALWWALACSEPAPDPMEEAVALQTRCIERHAPSCEAVVRRMSTGELPTDLNKKRDYAKWGCGPEFPHLCAVAAALYLSGEGGEQSDEKGLNLLAAGCEHGHTDSCERLGVKGRTP